MITLSTFQPITKEHHISETEQEGANVFRSHRLALFGTTFCV